MERNKVTTQNTIDAYKFILSVSPDPKKILQTLLYDTKLTSEFVREFKEYMDSSLFTKSAKLSKDLAEEFPELFNMGEFIEFYTNFEDTIEQGIAIIRLSKLSLEFFVELKGEIQKGLANTFGDSDYEDIFESAAIEIVRDATPEELEKFGVDIMGISERIDDILLKRIRSSEVRNAILLALSVSSGRTITETTFNYMGDEMKESLLGTENVDFSEFLKSVSSSKDLAWQINIINKAVSGEIQFIKNYTGGEDFISLCRKLPEDQILKFVKLQGVVGNIFTYQVVEILLREFSLHEETLLEMLPVIKQSGNYINLIKLAKAENYTTILGEK